MKVRRLIRGQARVGDLRDALDALGIATGDPFVVAAASEVARARTTDPETSHDAAARTPEELRETQRAVFNLFKEGPITGYTDERLVAVYQSKPHLPKQSASGIRSRRSELVDAGLVVYTGFKGSISTGRMARIWALTPPEGLA